MELGDAWSTVLPGEVYAIASHARRTGAGHFDAGPAVDKANTASGDKVELHAALLEGEPHGPVAVIVEPVRGPGVAEALASAYGLTPEESAVLSLVLRDRPTDESPSVLAKVGAADRHELVAKVYADHYALALEERQGVDARGWFDGIPHPLPVDDEEDEADPGEPGNRRGAGLGPFQPGQGVADGGHGLAVVGPQLLDGDGEGPGPFVQLAGVGLPVAGRPARRCRGGPGSRSRPPSPTPGRPGPRCRWPAPGRPPAGGWPAAGRRRPARR